MDEAEIESILRATRKSGYRQHSRARGRSAARLPYDKSRDFFQHAADLVKFIRRFNEIRCAS